MSGFEFVFTLFGLLLGLALAEGLGGLAKALKRGHRVKIGWPTALLGIFVSCDVVTFWMYAWSLREGIPVTWPSLFAGFLVCAVYFVAASLIFPDEDWEAIDAHFERHHRTVIGAVLLCNAVLLGVVIWLVGLAPMVNVRTAIITWTLFPIGIAAMVAKDRRVVVGCLLWLIALYPLSAVWR